MRVNFLPILAGKGGSLMREQSLNGDLFYRVPQIDSIATLWLILSKEVNAI